MTSFATPAPLPAWSLRLQNLEYERALPLLARLPSPAAYALARWRGQFNARLDRDWVSMALGHRHVAHLTAQGYREFIPEADVARALAERFETVSREELEARWLERLGLAYFDVEARAALERLAARPTGRGLVLLTSHFETFILGIAALAQRGERLHPMMSSVSADERLARGVRNHFTLKYAGLERHLNGGRLASAETQMRHLYRALQAGEIVVVIADAPGSAEAGLPLPWLGQVRSVAQGALRLAQATGSAMGAFMCNHLGGRRHAVALSAIEMDLVDEPGLKSVSSVYEFMEQHIRRNPGRWWSAHLLGSYPRWGSV